MLQSSSAQKKHTDGLAIILEYMALQSSGEALRPERIRQAIENEPEDLDVDSFQRVAMSLGFQAVRNWRTAFTFNKVPVPSLLILKKGELACLVAKGKSTVRLQYCGSDEIQEVGLKDLLLDWSGNYISLLYTPSADPQTENSISTTWRFFLSPLARYKSAILSILLMSGVFHALQLATPLFTQTILDRVLVHNTVGTLDVLAIGLVAVHVYQGAFGWLRGYVLPHTMARVDAELSSRIFDKALQLPQEYFDRRAVGDTVVRIREVETIRSFLADGALMTLIDALFALGVCAILFLYSPMLAMIMIASLFFYVLLSLLASPKLRTLIEEKFDRGAQQQSTLIEIVSGISTLKAFGIEPRIRRAWDGEISNYLAASFKADRLGNVVENLATVFDHLIHVLVLYIGALEVIAGRMTAGQLVAFNMLAGQLTQPTLKILGLWQQFQRCKVTVERLSDLIEAKPETATGIRLREPLAGRIEFQDVIFRYAQDGAEVLSQMSFNVSTGEVVGIVGPSGSGKSTISKLILGLYRPHHGCVKIDDQDVALLDPRQLRRNIGIVQQDSFLFNMSVLNNISIANNAATVEEIIEAAKTAGAHDFISKLPAGYETVIGERGASLSGGQRQRIAIARSLIGDPKILIFDEATSALDSESEMIIKNNMREITRGRTSIVIAHRLSTLRHVDRILVIEDGRLVESGPPAELLQDLTSRYHYFNSLQNA